MKEARDIHIAMMNSYNMLTEKASIEQIINSGVGLFAHSPEEDSQLESVEFMISYFKNIEMYEKCSELKKYIDNTFDEHGLYKEDKCECEMPEIYEYTPKVKCSICKLRVKR